MAQEHNFRTWAGFISSGRDQVSPAMYAVRYILRDRGHGKPLLWLHLAPSAHFQSAARYSATGSAANNRVELYPSYVKYTSLHCIRIM